MSDLRLSVRFKKGERWWHTEVTDEYEASSVIKDLRIPDHESKLEEAAIYRYGGYVYVSKHSIQWQGKAGESFEDFCEKLAAEEAIEEQAALEKKWYRKDES